MKNIKKRYAERVPLIPVGKSGRPDPLGTLRLKWELHFEFWSEVRVFLDPEDCFLEPGGPGERFYEDCNRPLSAGAFQESFRLMKHYLGVQRLTFGTWFKLRRIFSGLLKKAKSDRDVDIALCALVAFVRLELGEGLDAEYGSIPEPENPWDWFNDENWPDDEAELIAYLDRYEDFGTSEYHSMRAFQQWEKVINDPCRFEEAFPGMGQRSSNLAQALRPIFSGFDPVYGWHVLLMCFGWIDPLMKEPFVENRRGGEARNAITSAA